MNDNAVISGFGKAGKTLAALLRDAIYTHPTMTEAFNDLFAL
jgi:hypothetical protein